MDDGLDEQRARFIKFMSRHLVVLTCMRELLKSDGSVIGRDTLVFSGFVLELHGDWFWVTAGHCLKDGLDEQIQSGRMRVVGGGFMDYFGPDARHVSDVPYKYEPGDGLYVEDAEMGLDFGIIHLDSLKKAAFEKNGIIAISRSNWEHQWSLDFDHYKMLGIPAREVYPGLNTGDPFSIGLRPQMLALELLPADEVKNPEPSSKDWFIGRLVQDAAAVEDIAGMSGGPIYGFRKHADGHWSYHVVAVQSRWRRGPKIIFGCSLPLFAEEVHRQLAAFIAPQGPDAAPNGDEGDALN